MALSIVPLREGKPSLQDIPALLRKLAMDIENGSVTAETVFVVIPQTGTYPQLFGWGDVDGDRGPIVQIALMQQWLLTNVIERRS